MISWGERFEVKGHFGVFEWNFFGRWIPDVGQRLVRACRGLFPSFEHIRASSQVDFSTNSTYGIQWQPIACLNSSIWCTEGVRPCNVPRVCSSYATPLLWSNMHGWDTIGAHVLHHTSIQLVWWFIAIICWWGTFESPSMVHNPRDISFMLEIPRMGSDCFPSISSYIKTSCKVVHSKYMMVRDI